MPTKSLFARWFVPASLAEGVSFLVLLGIGMPLKYAAGLPIATAVTGSVHGALFIAYVALALLGRGESGWGLKHTAWILLMSVLPAGAFFAERSVKAELAGRSAGLRAAAGADREVTAAP